MTARKCCGSHEVVWGRGYGGWVILCELCREEVDPRDEDVVAARRMKRIVSNQVGVEWLEGQRVAFHRWCFPAGSPHYQLTDKPTELG